MSGAINGVTLRPSRRVERPRDAGVIVQCHHLVCAIAVRWIVRLVLPESVEHVAPGLVKVGNELYASWDLGERLGLPPLKDAWALCRASYDHVEVPIALSTGACLSVQPLPKPAEIPFELFGSRRDVVINVFVAGPQHGGALFGLELDLLRMWEPAELAASAALVQGGARR